MGEVGLPIPYGPHDGWGVFGPSVPVRGGKKNRFLPNNRGPRRVKVTTSSHHTCHATVHERVEEADTRGQLGFPKTLDELRKLKEFADGEV